VHRVAWQMPACGLLVIVGKERISDRIARRGPDAMQNQVRHNVERLARQRKLARVVSCRDARLSKSSSSATSLKYKRRRLSRCSTLPRRHPREAGVPTSSASNHSFTRNACCARSPPERSNSSFPSRSGTISERCRATMVA
jgi:hypothetical protein